MAKPRRVTELLKWMMEKGINDIELAALMTERVPGRSISARQVFRWKRGLSYPRPAYLLELEKLSEGRVTAKTLAADFHPPPDKEPPDGS